MASRLNDIMNRIGNVRSAAGRGFSAEGGGANVASQTSNTARPIHAGGQSLASTRPGIVQEPPSPGKQRVVMDGLPKSFAKLPRSCILIVEDLAQERAEVLITQRMLSGQVADAMEERNGLQTRRTQLMDRNYTAKPLKADDPMITGLDQEIGRLQALIDRLMPRRDHLAATSSNTGQLLTYNLTPYAERLNRLSDADLWVGTPSSAKKGEPLGDAIERCQRRIRELHADAEAVRAAPLHSAVIIEAEVARINALAEQGLPNALFAIERGEPLLWPTLMNAPEATGLEQIGGAIKTPDYMAIMAAMFRDRMIEVAKQVIIRDADDAAALSHDERSKRLAQIARDKLAVERDEVALIRAAKLQHQPVLFRPDTDARAFLGLADSCPAPRPQ